MKRTRGDYGPKLTKRIKRDLEAEIASFNEKKTLRILEQNAVGKPDIELEERFHNTDPRSNPDMLDYEKAQVPWGRNSPDPDIIKAKKEIRSMLPLRQRQIWEYVMDKGLSITKTAERMGLSQPTVTIQFQRAKKKVEQYFSGGYQ